MIIYSDINLEPFLKLKKNENLNFIYTEDYIFPDEIENKTVLFIFSDYFRVYSENNFKKIIDLVDNASVKNQVYLVADLFYNSYVFSTKYLSINSQINNNDYNLELGYYSQFPFNKSGIVKIQNLITLITNKTKNPLIKSIFVDLDNTLIPGVWEEDNVFIRQNYLSHKMWKFRRLLKILVKCHSHGSQIIIVSKNEKDSIVDALDFISPFWKDFITHIDYGWGSKGERIQNIIKKMNIGSQDCLFIDDNKIEINNVLKKIPDVKFVHFDNHEKLSKIEKICLSGLKFNMLLDKNRNEFYSNILGDENQMNIGISKTNYKHQINLNDSSSFGRIKELSVKTNQMNFNKSEIIFIDNSKYDYYTVKCVTEFSDLGIVGYFEYDKNKNLINNFVMSCRALGFGLEDAFIESALKITTKFNFTKSKRNGVAQLLVEKYLKNGKITI